MSSPWGSRTINAVAANGVVTVLFPAFGSAVGAMADTSNTGAYPPVASGNVRRACHGKITAVEVAGDGINAVTVELWDVGGLDRGPTYTQDNVNGVNTNNDDKIPNGQLVAQGAVKIGTKLIPGTGDGTFTERFEAIPFNLGLGIRVVGAAGSVVVSPFCEGGFMIQAVHS